ncbi:3'-5' exonuclease [Paenibacillus sp. Leaf72]|uniref:3'-5' exonuclease n=1 Tax=Paenibacillus sp. Leaf72 TaxID=1736234 RepID=UPI0006F85D92|nr:3'-5' exonuclease [Paenibacillus sp. Leaf72]KQN97005.1 hypothetical protein ASF12_23335 [Paenibacillus sp. Leaf72]
MLITLAIELFQEDNRFSMSMYCDIEDKKRGYMFIDHGNVSHQEAIGKSILAALKPLVKNYKHHSLNLAMPNIYLSLIHPQIKSEIELLLSMFISYNLTMDRYHEALHLVNTIGTLDNRPKGKLYGYSMDDLKRRQETLESDIKANKLQTAAISYKGVMLPENAVIIDFETTSVHIKYARIIEVGAIKISNGQIIDRFDSLCNPGMKIPKAVRLLTGIKQADVDLAPKGYSVMKKLIEFIDNSPVLIGHNISGFDYELFQNFLNRFNLPKWKGELLCTKKLAKQTQLVTPDYKLDTLCSKLGIINDSPHRALSDCEATFKTLIALYNLTLFKVPDLFAKEESR